MAEQVRGHPDDGKKDSFLLAGLASVAHAAGLDAKMGDAALELAKQFGIDPQIKSDVKQLRADLDLLSAKIQAKLTDKEKLEEMRLGLEILKRHYAICICEKQSVPMCCRWWFP